MIKRFVILVALLVVAVPAAAESRPLLRVAPVVLVRSGELALGDIASFERVSKSRKDFVDELRAIPLGPAPAPLSQQNLLGVSVLEAVEKAGIDTDSFVYSIPKAIMLKREGRVVGKDEVLAAVVQQIASEGGPELRARDVVWEIDRVTPLGASKVEVKRLGRPAAGRLPGCGPP